MARQVRTNHTASETAAAAGPATPSNRGGAEELGPAGLGGARQWWHQSLQAAQGTAGVLEQMQRINTEMLQAWTETLAQADREVGKAGDLGVLMAMPTQLAQRQLEVAMERAKTYTQQLLEAELEWADRVREQAAVLGQSWLANLGRFAALPAAGANGSDSAGAFARAAEGADAAATAAPGNGLDRWMLDTFKQTQDNWLAMSRQWADRMSANVRPVR